MRTYIIFTGIILAVFFLFHIADIYELVLKVLQWIWRISYPFIIALLIAYLLAPIVLHFEKLGMKRTLGIVIVMCLLISSIIFVLYIIYPYLLSQIYLFSEQLPIAFSIYEDWINQVHIHVDTFPDVFHDQFYELVAMMEEVIENRLYVFMEKLTNVFDLFITLLIVPVIVFYMLRDGSKWEAFLLDKMKGKQRSHIIHMRNILTEHFGKYLLSQLMVLFFITIWMFVTYYLLGIPYPILFALFAGVMNIIPYIGPLLGSVPALLSATIISWPAVLIVIVSTVIVQMLETMILSPYIIGKQIELHPLLVIIAILIGAEIAGIIGMVVMIPVFSIAKALMTEGLPRKDIDIDIY